MLRSPRELDQIRDHSGAWRMFFTAEVSEEAAAHATRYDVPVQHVGPLHGELVSTPERPRPGIARQAGLPGGDAARNKLLTHQQPG
jgi:hypothetical protein